MTHIIFSFLVCYIFTYVQVNSARICDVDKWINYIKKPIEDLGLSKTSEKILENNYQHGIQCSELKLIHKEASGIQKEFKKKLFYFDTEDNHEDNKKDENLDDLDDTEINKSVPKENVHVEKPTQKSANPVKLNKNLNNTINLFNYCWTTPLVKNISNLFVHTFCSKTKSVTSNAKKNSNKKNNISIQQCFICPTDTNIKFTIYCFYFANNQSQNQSLTKTTFLIENKKPILNQISNSNSQYLITCNSKLYSQKQLPMSNYTTHSMCLFLFPLLYNRRVVPSFSSDKFNYIDNSNFNSNIKMDKTNRSQSKHYLEELLTSQFISILRNKLKYEENENKIKNWTEEMTGTFKRYQQLTQETLQELVEHFNQQLHNISNAHNELIHRIVKDNVVKQKKLRRLENLVRQEKIANAILSKKQSKLTNNLDEFKDAVTDILKKLNIKINNVNFTVEEEKEKQKLMKKIENKTGTENVDAINATQQLKEMQIKINELENKLNLLNVSSEQRKTDSKNVSQSFFSCFEFLEKNVFTQDFEVVLLNISQPMTAVKTLCDFKNQGWTTILSRKDGSIDFYRDWIQYESGFGNPETEFWIGLKALELLTAAKPFKLWVELEDWEGERRSVFYSQFGVGNALNGYPLHIAGFQGDSIAGDSLSSHNESKFSSMDVDNDKVVTKFNGSCAARFHGAFWYYSCYKANPTGRYYAQAQIPDKQFDGIVWKTWKGVSYSLKSLTMKIKESLS